MKGNWVGVGGLVSLVAVIACSGGAGSVSSGSAATNESFVEQFCAVYQPCCGQLGLRTDGQQCKALATLSASQGTYNAQAGGQCLGELRAAAGSSTFCTAPSSPSICGQVYGAAGSKQPGDACTDDDECAVPQTGDVDCAYHYGPAGENKRYCQVRLPGKAGDKPCVGTRKGSVLSSSGSSKTAEPIKQGYVCDVKDGVRCDSESTECKAFSQIDEPCTSSDSCVEAAFCDYAAKKCVARVPLDGDCSKNSQACAIDTYCDSTSKKCAAGKEIGAECSSSSMCKSGACSSSKCVATNLSSMSLICGKI